MNTETNSVPPVNTAERSPLTGAAINGQIIDGDVTDGKLPTLKVIEENGKQIEVLEDSDGNEIARQEITVVGAALEAVNLDKDVVVAGTTVKAGTEFQATPERKAKIDDDTRTKEVRRDIKNEVADTESLVGSSLDGVQLILSEFISFLEGAANAKDVKAVNKLAQDTLDKFGNGVDALKSATMPYESRGTAATVVKIAERGQKTAEILTK